MDNYDLWKSDELPIEEILRRVRGQARANKLDTDAAMGKYRSVGWTTEAR